MMSGFELNEHIPRSPEEVFAMLSNPTRATEFLDNITECKQLTDGPIAVGTRFRETRVMRPFAEIGSPRTPALRSRALERR